MDCCLNPTLHLCIWTHNPHKTLGHFGERNQLILNLINIPHSSKLYFFAKPSCQISLRWVNASWKQSWAWNRSSARMITRKLMTAPGSSFFSQLGRTRNNGCSPNFHIFALFQDCDAGLHACPGLLLVFAWYLNQQLASLTFRLLNSNNNE